MSPELLDPDRFGPGDGHPTKESDCYALGMVVYEVLSGQVPFAQYKVVIVMGKVINGERPVRPQGDEGNWFTDDLWGMLERCWSPQPESRPPLETVRGCLEEVLRPSSDVGDDEETRTDVETESTASGPRMFPCFFPRPQ